MNINILLPIVQATTQPLELLVRVNITNVYANPSSNTILPTVRESMKYRELPAAVNTTAVLFVPIVPSRLKTVHMAVPNITPVTVVLPVNPTPIAVRRRFPVTTDVPRPTPAVSAPLVRATLTAT